MLSVLRLKARLAELLATSMATTIATPSATPTTNRTLCSRRRLMCCCARRRTTGENIGASLWHVAELTLFYFPQPAGSCDEKRLSKRVRWYYADPANWHFSQN